jgi:hypothetical protein
MSAALSFENLKLNIFGCELSPNPAVSDYYTFGRGGAGQPDSQNPSSAGVNSLVSSLSGFVAPVKEVIGFAEPTRATPDVSNVGR